MCRRVSLLVVFGWVTLSPFLGQGPNLAQADVTTLTATDAGFFNAEGRSSKNDGVVLGAADATFNYSVGAIDEIAPLSGIDVPRKNYFTFDLSGVSEPITAAKLMLFNPSGAPGGYSSPDPSEIYTLGGTAAASSAEMTAFATELTGVYDITSAPALATAKSLFGKIADLLPGSPLGSIVVSDAMDGTTVEIDFTADGLDYLNMFAGGSVVVGGTLESLDGSDSGDEVMFGFTKPLISGVVAPDPPIVGPTPTPTLMITTTAVPEPTAFPLLAVFAIVAVCLSIRYRYRLCSTAA